MKALTDHSRRLDFSEHIKVFVGAQKKSFVVHKDVITRRSPFFKSACAKCWAKNAECPKINLPEDDPTIFGVFLQCIYQNVVPTELAQETFELMAKVYVFADKVGDLTTANLIIDEFTRLSDKIQEIPGLDTIAVVFQRTSENAPLRRLIVDFCIREAPISWLSELSACFEALPPSFFAAFMPEYGVVKASSRQKTVKDAFCFTITDREKCHYHVHDEDHPECDWG